MPASVVKFKTNFIGRTIPQDERIVDLRRWAKIFHEKNLAPIIDGVSCGNFSFRVSPESNEFIITASQMGFDQELPDDGLVLVKDCNFENGIITAVGAREPSSESMLHFAIYNAHREVQFIFHGHSPEILANSQKLKLVETESKQPYGTVALAKGVLKVLDDNKIIVMKEHGFVSVGDTADSVGGEAINLLAKI